MRENTSGSFSLYQTNFRSPLYTGYFQKGKIPKTDDRTVLSYVHGLCIPFVDVATHTDIQVKLAKV